MSGFNPVDYQTVSGTGSATNTAATTIIAAPSEGCINVASLQLGRTDAGTTPITVTLNDSAGTVLVLDNAGNGKSIPFVFDVPLVLAAKTALTMAASTGVSTLYGSAQGFLRP